MKVILFEENRVTEVKDGYARNFLFPRRLAVLATPLNVKKFEKKMAVKAEEIEESRKSAKTVAEKIEASEVLIKAEAGEEGKLFGSVTAQDVADALLTQLEIEIPKRKINLNEHIKAVGDYTASVKLHHAVTAHLKVKVEKL